MSIPAYFTIKQVADNMLRDAVERHKNTTTEIAKELGISVRKVQYMRKRLGIPGERVKRIRVFKIQENP